MKLILSTMVLLIGTSCSSMLDKTNPEALKKVKKVAVIGFTLDHRQANSGKNFLGAMLGKEKTMPGMGKTSFKIKYSDYSREVYKEMKRRLGQDLNWRVVSDRQLGKSRTLNKFYRYKNRTIQGGVAPLASRYDRYEMKGIPQFYYIQQASPEQRAQMARELGVDAVVILNLKTRISQTSIMGLGVGSVKTIGDSYIGVFSGHDGSLILNMNQSGEAVESKESKFMGFTSEDENEVQALHAFKQTGQTITKKIKKHL